MSAPPNQPLRPTQPASRWVEKSTPSAATRRRFESERASFRESISHLLTSTTTTTTTFAHGRACALFRQREENWRHVFRVGLPMLTFVLLGTYGLTGFMQTKFERQGSSIGGEADYKAANELRRARKLAQRPKFSMDDELAKMQREVDLDAWQQRRIPRPGEARDGTAGGASGASE